MLLLIALFGCAEAPTYQYGEQVALMQFELFTLDEGVHPDTSVLADPNNPFAEGLTGDTKWDIEAHGYPVPAFYAWATMLVLEPTGEHQFYTAVNLHRIYARALAEPDELYFVRDMALRGYQVVLDEFPDSVTYDAAGRIPYPLAPLAFAGIEDLGGTPEGWTRVGEGTVVPVGDR